MNIEQWIIREILSVLFQMEIGQTFVFLAGLFLLFKYLYSVISNYGQRSYLEKILVKDTIIKTMFIIANVCFSIGLVVVLIELSLFTITKHSQLLTKQMGVFFLMAVLMIGALVYVIGKFRVLSTNEVIDAFNDTGRFSEESVSHLSALLTTKLTGEFITSSNELNKLLSPPILDEIEAMYQELLGRSIDPWAVVTHGVELYRVKKVNIVRACYIKLANRYWGRKDTVPTFPTVIRERFWRSVLYGVDPDNTLIKKRIKGIIKSHDEYKIRQQPSAGGQGVPPAVM